MSEYTDQEAQIFNEALEIPADRRDRYLDEVCKADTALRGRVDDLVRAYEAAGDFMSADRTLDTLRLMADYPRPMPSEEAGERMGRYKLLQKLGEGGCGVVWMAEQEEPVHRRVAIKIIKLGMDTNEVIARFEAERQALALMDHPHIAKIFDAGTSEAGRPFFVMELVRGVQVTDYSDEHTLTLRQRLELFCQICQAVQHAHQKGIIHRDLKPSNVLVSPHDGVPEPKVIDFGIAKATEGRLTNRTFFTAFEQFIGTPAYMSPEQAEMSAVDIDTRSDIYSLGILLYELLCGHPPFDPKALAKQGIDEIRRIIREVDPKKPSLHLAGLSEDERKAVARLRGTDPARLAGQLAGDLDWIVMRCLEKSRARRYETPAALAADLSRHLNNEPVLARPPSRLYKFGRLFRRNRLAFTAAAAVVLALVAGSIISTWQAVRATRAERTARLERSQAVLARGRAEDLLQFMLGDLYTQLDRVGRLDVLEGTADKALAYYSSLSPSDLNDTTELARAKGLRLLGGVRLSQARYADATAAFTESYKRAAELAARHPSDGEMLFERGQDEYWLGYVHFRRGEYIPAEDWFVRYRDTATALLALDPAKAKWQREFAYGQHNLAVLREGRGELVAARSDFVAELAAWERMAGADPTNLDILAQEADIQSWLGGIAERQGDLVEARKRYSAQAAQLDILAHSDPKTANRQGYEANALVYEATIDIASGRYADAAETLGKARQLLDTVVARDPSNTDWKSLNLIALLAEATFDRQRGHAVRSARLVGEALPQLEAVVTAEPGDHVFTRALLMAWRLKAQLQAAADDSGASVSAAKAAAIAERLARADGATDAEIGESAKALVVRGEIAAQAGDTSLAESSWHRAADLVAPRLKDSRDWRLLDPGARAAAHLGYPAEARALIQTLNLVGYVPPDPWPDVGHDDIARASIQKPK
ncbi:MAG TPA: serine/threonine-protein kinase [Opitutaceae bacterium]|jgi:serine/threonine protein kinase